MTDEPTNGNGNAKTFRRSESICALVGALAKAQGEMTGAKKDAENPFFRSKYADLQSVWDAIRAPLSKNELAILQFPRSTRDGVEVETLLAHSSGEWVSETLTLPVAKYDPQGVGSAITYARRYGLQSITGVAPEDDDGNAAVNSNHHSVEANRLSPQEQLAARKANPQPPAPPRCSQQQQDAIRDIADELGIAAEQRIEILRQHNVKRVNLLTVDQAANIVLDLCRRRIREMLTEQGVNLDDVRLECPDVTADLPDELDQEQANAALTFLRAAKERAA